MKSSSVTGEGKAWTTCSNRDCPAVFVPCVLMLPAGWENYCGSYGVIAVLWEQSGQLSDRMHEPNDVSDPAWCANVLLESS